MLISIYIEGVRLGKDKGHGHHDRHSLGLIKGVGGGVGGPLGYTILITNLHLLIYHAWTFQ